jgi:hypothetical protein
MALPMNNALRCARFGKRNYSDVLIARTLEALNVPHAYFTSSPSMT